MTITAAQVALWESEVATLRAALAAVTAERDHWHGKAETYNVQAARTIRTLQARAEQAETALAAVTAERDAWIAKAKEAYGFIGRNNEPTVETLLAEKSAAEQQRDDWQRRYEATRLIEEDVKQQRDTLQQACGQASPETVVECFRQVVVRAKERGFVGEVADYETATEQLLPLIDGVLTLREQRDTALARVAELEAMFAELSVYSGSVGVIARAALSTSEEGK